MRCETRCVSPLRNVAPHRAHLERSGNTWSDSPARRLPRTAKARVGRCPQLALRGKRGRLIPARPLPRRETLSGEGPESRTRPTAREIMMYPDLEIARTRIAELHHLAERADLAIALGRARRARRDRTGPAMPARLARTGRRLLALDRTRPASSAE